MAIVIMEKCKNCIHQRVCVHRIKLHTIISDIDTKNSFSSLIIKGSCENFEEKESNN